MKGKTNSGATFKVERKEANKHNDKEEKDNVEIQVAFKSEVQDESWL